MYVLSDCFRVCYTANWASLYLAVFPSDSILCTLYIVGPDKHYSLYLYQQKILQPHKISIFKREQIALSSCGFLFKLQITRGSGNIRMTSVCCILDNVRYFFLNEQMSIDQIKKIKRKGKPIISTKYIIIYFCNVYLRAKDVWYMEYYER